MSKIKMPVQYNAGHLRDRTGALLLCCQLNDDDVDAKNGNQIADAINEHADLKARLADANRGTQVNALVNESLAKKLKLAVEALGHYADKSNWDANKGFANDVWYLTERGWSIADETLAKIKEPSKGRDV